MPQSPQLCVLSTWYHFQQRRSHVSELAVTTQDEHGQLQALQKIVGEQRAVLEGLRADDPYVVELLARERYKYRRRPTLARDSAAAADDAKRPECGHWL